MLPYRCVSPQCAMPLCQSYTRFDACPVSCLRCMSPCSTPVLLLSLLSPGSRPVSAGSLCCKLVLALPDFKPTQASQALSGSAAITVFLFHATRHAQIQMFGLKTRLSAPNAISSAFLYLPFKLSSSMIYCVQPAGCALCPLPHHQPCSPPRPSLVRSAACNV